jgi:hypothetical protein
MFVLESAPAVDTRVVLGWPFDECGGEGSIPTGECPMCFGLGTIEHVVSLAGFREFQQDLFG